MKDLKVIYFRRKIIKMAESRSIIIHLQNRIERCGGSRAVGPISPAESAVRNADRNLKTLRNSTTQRPTYLIPPFSLMALQFLRLEALTKNSLYSQRERPSSRFPTKDMQNKRGNFYP